jgi:hypothetical protein
MRSGGSASSTGSTPAMSETSLPEHSRYEVIAYANGEVPVYYETFGSYQGEWLLMGYGEKGRGKIKGPLFSLYRGHYGSCSGCDAYESADPSTIDEAREFAADYLPFASIPARTMRTLCSERTLVEILPKNFRDDYQNFGEGDLPSLASAAAAFMASAKLHMGWPLDVRDITEVENQELRQRALRVYGYEEWVKDVGGESLQSDECGELVKAGEVLFVRVVDPSTGRVYLLRVPPTIETARAAVAWTFGFERVSDYQPSKQT